MLSPEPASQSFHAKIPAEWRQLGRPMHLGWSALAETARSIKDKDVALEQLAEIGGYCSACHATFQIKLNPAAKASPPAAGSHGSHGTHSGHKK